MSHLKVGRRRPRFTIMKVLPWGQAPWARSSPISACTFLRSCALPTASTTPGCSFRYCTTFHRIFRGILKRVSPAMSSFCSGLDFFAYFLARGAMLEPCGLGRDDLEGRISQRGIYAERRSSSVHVLLRIMHRGCAAHVLLPSYRGCAAHGFDPSYRAAAPRSCICIIRGCAAGVQGAQKMSLCKFQIYLQTYKRLIQRPFLLY